MRSVTKMLRPLTRGVTLKNTLQMTTPHSFSATRFSPSFSTYPIRRSYISFPGPNSSYHVTFKSSSSSSSSSSTTPSTTKILQNLPYYKIAGENRHRKRLLDLMISLELDMEHVKDLLGFADPLKTESITKTLEHIHRKKKASLLQDKSFLNKIFSLSNEERDDLIDVLTCNGALDRAYYVSSRIEDVMINELKKARNFSATIKKLKAIQDVFRKLIPNNQKTLSLRPLLDENLVGITKLIQCEESAAAIELAVLISDDLFKLSGFRLCEYTNSEVENIFRSLNHLIGLENYYTLIAKDSKHAPIAIQLYLSHRERFSKYPLLTKQCILLNLSIADKLVPLFMKMPTFGTDFEKRVAALVSLYEKRKSLFDEIDPDLVYHFNSEKIIDHLPVLLDIIQLSDKQPETLHRILISETWNLELLKKIREQCQIIHNSGIPVSDILFGDIVRDAKNAIKNPSIESERNLRSFKA